MNDLEAAEKAWSNKLDRIEALVAENAKGIAENAKAITEMEKTTAKTYEALQWVPLKTGLWTVGLLLSLLIALAKVPYALSVIMFLIGRG